MERFQKLILTVLAFLSITNEIFCNHNNIVLGDYYFEYSNDVFFKSLDSCEYYTHEALKCYQESGDANKIFKAKMGILGLNMYQKKFFKCEKIIKSLKETDINKLNKKNQARLYNFEGVYEMEVGAFNKAILAFNKCLNCVKNGSIERFTCLMNLIESSNQIGNFQFSQSIINETIKGDFKNFEKYSFGDLKLFSGKIQLELQNFSESETELRLAISNYEKLDEGEFKALRMHSVYAVLADVYLATRNLIQLDSIIESKYFKKNTANYYYLKSFISDKNKKSLLSKKAIEKAKNIAYQDIGPKQIKQYDLIVDIEILNTKINGESKIAIRNLYHSYVELKSNLTASQKAKLIIALFKYNLDYSHRMKLSSDLKLTFLRLRKQITSESFLKHWAKNNTNTFQLGIDQLIVEQQNYHALILVDENKSNILFDALINGQHTIESDIPDSIFYQRTSLISQIAFQKKAKSEADSTNTEAIEYHESNIFNLEHNLKLLEDKYFKANEYFAFDTMHVEELQRNMAEDELIIEHFWADSLLYHFYVTKDTIEVELQNNAYLVDSLCQQYTQQIQNQNTHFNQTSKALCTALFTSESKFWNTNYKQITFIPDGPLSKIAFESLIDPSDQYLIQTKNISYQYSLKSKYILEKEKTHKVETVAAYGYTKNNEGLNFSRSCNSFEEASLICAETEKNSILNLFSQTTSQQTLNNKNDFVNALGSDQIIHVATHACSDLDDPDMNRLFFDDGPLTSLELRDANGMAELVSVSACHSGDGKLYLGEGSMSLSKDLLSTGVKSTMVGLWTIDDCSSLQLTKSIYNYIKEGKSKNFAISQAKRDYLTSAHPEKSHPYYWSSLVLIGNPDALSISSPLPWLIYVIAFISFVVLFYFFRYYQKGRVS